MLRVGLGDLRKGELGGFQILLDSSHGAVGLVANCLRNPTCRYQVNSAAKVQSEMNVLSQLGQQRLTGSKLGRIHAKEMRHTETRATRQ